MKHSSYIELDKNALKQNIKYLKQRIGDAKFASVIKGNAYGHEIKTFLPMAEECGINYFAVSDAYEAELAFKAKRPKTHIMIMAMIDKYELEWAIRNEISFFVFDINRLKNAVKIAKEVKKPAIIHIELETGLNRTGFAENQLNEVIKIIENNRKYVQIEGICTHYAGAESIANYVRVERQRKKFHEVNIRLYEQGIRAKYSHTACSAAALTYPDTIMDMVRLGIAQYGFWPSKETRMYNLLSDDTTFQIDPLKRILSWKSRIMTVQKVKQGEFVSYGNSFMAPYNMIIAVVPVGYCHGYSRSLSNLGQVLIRGQKANIVGMVNMNMLLTDVTEIEGAAIDDEVVLIGTQGDLTITVSSFSDLANYVNYELLAHLPDYIPRLILER